MCHIFSQQTIWLTQFGNNYPGYRVSDVKIFKGFLEVIQY